MGGFDSYKLVIALVGMQIWFAGINIFSKAVLHQGVSPRVFVAYRQGLATIVLAPLAFLSRRRNSWGPPLGLKCFVWILVASLFGVTALQSTYFEGLNLASSSAASAMVNMIPAITFVIATICGMENIRITSSRSIAKILGTICCVGGAIWMTLFKGSSLLNVKFLTSKSILRLDEGDKWLLGCFLLFAGSCFWSLWIILLVPISAGCPDPYYSSLLISLLATLETTTIALLVEKDVSVWKLNSFEIACILFAGIGQVVIFLIQAWCVKEKGPVFTAVFNPLSTVIVFIFTTIILHEIMYIGSLVGALVVIFGLYLVLWGKAKDEQESQKKVRNQKKQKDEVGTVQILVGDSSTTKNSRIKLEEPLLY